MPQTHDPSPHAFGRELRALLIAQGRTSAMGNPAWAELGRELRGYKYETLRKAVTGERRPTVGLIESVALALNVRPLTFTEYQLLQARESLDPSVVGWESSLKNLETWRASSESGS